MSSIEKVIQSHGIGELDGARAGGRIDVVALVVVF
jgi:hypothetical protein